MIRNLAALIRDLADYNAGVTRARNAYAAKTSGMCEAGHRLPPTGRCLPCHAETMRRNRARKDAK